MSVKKVPKVVYDRESDSLCIVLHEGFEEDFIELAPNINLELGKGGTVICIEILKASKLFREEGTDALRFLKTQA
ncbi:MAG: DUF2283 domain-containing protein [Thermoproteota archaeon]